MKSRDVISTVLSVALFSSMIALGVRCPKQVNADDLVSINEVHFPDKAFRTYISSKIDKDRDGYLDSYETGTIYDESIDYSEDSPYVMNLGELGITDLTGIEFFPNLMYLYAWDNNISSIDLTEFPLLREIYLGGNPIKTIDTSKCPELLELNVYGCNLTKLDVSNNTELTFLSIGENPIKAIDISKCTKLEEINAYQCNLSSLDVSKNTELLYLYVSENNLSSLNVSNLTNLNELHCSGNRIKKLDLTGLAFLQTLQCHKNTMTELNLSGCKSLKWAMIMNNNIGNVNLTDCPSLSDIYQNSEKHTFSDAVSVYGDYSIRDDGELGDTGAIFLMVDDSTKVSCSVSSESGVSGFVERLYSVALDRSSDPNGKADWVQRIRAGQITGADAARGFFLSPEFINSQLSDDEFLNRLYHTFFDREPDEGGFNNWKTVLAGGATRESVLDGFINSTEWANLCLTYGIASGGTGTPNVVIKPNDQIIGFASRLYTTCLGRDYDQGGLDDWASRLANMKVSGSEAAHGFFFSEEFISHDFSNDEYVTRLYRTFMGREPDPAGFADWTGQLANGATRESVFQGFAGSAEWAAICSEYGILK